MSSSEFGANGRSGARPMFWHGLGGVALFVLGWVVSQSASAGSVDATLKAQAAEISDLKVTLGSAIQDQSRTNTEVAEALSALKAEVANLKDATLMARHGDRPER
jgi:hypothetical protein